ncbi:MAG: hypothetical protein M3282_04265 [Gemmatimonadota bacterium]|nr:hypothetical protein [Gemmatimonadota bacterium]
MRQTDRTLQEYHTTLPAAEVLAQAKNWFAKRNGVYAAFLEREGPTFVTFRGQGGEELVIGTTPKDNGTLVTGSTYLFDMQIARFFATLPPFELVEGLLGGGEAGARDSP